MSDKMDHGDLELLSRPINDVIATDAGEASIVTDPAIESESRVVAPDPRLEPGSSKEPRTPSGSESGGRSPEERADRTAAHYHNSTGEIIDCGVEVMEAWNALRHDEVGLRRYVEALVARGMLTELEAADPQGSAKLSNLRKVGGHADMLRHPEIARLVGPGYTKLAVCASISDHFPGTQQDKLQGLLGVLHACPNEEVDRHYLIAENKRLERERNAPQQPDDEAPEETAESAGTTTMPEVIEQKKRFNRVMLFLRDSNKRFFTKSLADPEQLERQLPLKNIFAENAGLVVSAEVRDLAFILEHPLFRACFTRPALVLLVRKPAVRAISKQRVLIAFDRGDLRPHADCEIWADDAETSDDAARIYPGGHWLHLFAEQSTAGSTTVVGDDSWLDAPGGSK